MTPATSPTSAPDDRPAVNAAVRAMLDGGPGLLLPHTRDGQVRPIPARSYDAAGTGRPAPGLVLFTSGSTGEPKGVALSPEALVASARATEDLLSGPGRWHLCLPHNHIAGLQVILRALLAGAPPTVASTSGFDPVRFAEDLAGTLAAAGSAPVYTSLVPTQLVRALQVPEAARTLARTAAVLLGGAAVSPRLLERAADAGIPVVRTYGMSETAGGCVYDGVPFPQVDVRIAGDGRIVLGGPVLADGYVRVATTAAEVRVTALPQGPALPGLAGAGQATVDTASAAPSTSGDHSTSPDRTASAAPATGDQPPAADRTASAADVPTDLPADLPGGFHGEGDARVLVTSDLGRWEPADASGRTAHLSVLGRADDVIVTGGENVSPHSVENLLLPVVERLGFAEVLVTSRPHPEWGELLVALLVPPVRTSAEASVPTAAEAVVAIRADLRSRGIRGAEVPREVLVVESLPMRSIGKPDRAAARGLAIATEGRAAE